MSFIVTGRDIPTNCFMCPLDKGVWKQEQDPFILCRYTKEIVRYDDVPTDRRLPCCGLREMPEKHGRLIDGDALREKMYHDAFETDSKMQRWDSGCWIRYKMFENNIDDVETIVEAEGDI